MFNNLECQSFKNNINNIIKNCGLPPVAAYYILKDSLNELLQLSNQAILMEQQKQLQLLKLDKDLEEA